MAWLSPKENVTNFALVTPTYAPDYARCELLVESVERCMPETDLYLIVDPGDQTLFRQLARDHVSIINSSVLLGKKFRRIPGRRSIWLTPRFRLTRGWILQQIYKLEFARRLDVDIAVLCDSDVVFVRGLDASALLRGGKIGLLDVDYQSEQVQQWTCVAAQILGLDPKTVTPRGHVGNLICWSPQHVDSMLRHIEGTTGDNWVDTILSVGTFSEYILYGVYVREILGYDASYHFPSQEELVSALWGYNLDSGDAITQLFADIPPQTVAVMIHSKGGVEPDAYRPFVESYWGKGQ